MCPGSAPIAPNSANVGMGSCFAATALWSRQCLRVCEDGRSSLVALQKLVDCELAGHFVVWDQIWGCGPI